MEQYCISMPIQIPHIPPYPCVEPYEEHKKHTNEIGKQLQYDNQGYISEPIPCPLCGLVL